MNIDSKSTFCINFILLVTYEKYCILDPFTKCYQLKYDFLSGRLRSLNERFLILPFWLQNTSYLKISIMESLQIEETELGG